MRTALLALLFAGVATDGTEYRVNGGRARVQQFTTEAGHICYVVFFTPIGFEEPRGISCVVPDRSRLP